MKEYLAGEFIDLENGYAVCVNPGGRWHKWLFRVLEDGRWVSVKKLEAVEMKMGDYEHNWNPAAL